MALVLRRSLSFFLAALPTIVFVMLCMACGLPIALIGTVATAVVVFAIRLIRRQPIRPMVLGLLIATLCVGVATGTGEARDFFLAPIIVPAIALVVCLVTILIGRPFAGILLNRVSGGPLRWYEDCALRRIYIKTTWIAALISLLNAVSQGYFYVTNQPIVLGAIHIFTTAVFSILVAATSVAVRRELGRPSLSLGTGAAQMSAPSLQRQPDRHCRYQSLP